MSYLLDYNPGTQQYTYPRRGGAQLSGTVIVHTAECARDDIGEDTSAEACANFIANRADYGSYHRLVDSDSIIDMVPYEYEAWQDSETNNWAVGISAALATSDWLTMPSDRRDRVYRNLAACGAEFVVYMRENYGIDVPRERITGAQARARKPGFCAHGDSGIARTDPGANFDWALFFFYINQILGGSIAPQGSTQEDELSAAEVLDLKTFFQTDNENRHVATRNTVNNRLDALEYALKVFIQQDNEARHLATRAAAALQAEAVLNAIKSIPDVSDEIIEEVKAALDTAVSEALDNLKITIAVEKPAEEEEVTSETA